MTLPTSAPAAAKKPIRPSDRFIAYVHDLCDSNGTRATLRRGLGLPVERCNYLHRYLVPWTSEQMHPDAKRAHYAVAALIAARPRTARDTPPTTPADDDAAANWYARPNLGAALGRAVNQQVLKPATAESALHLMSRQSTDAIHPSLPALTRQLLNGNVAIDWAVLLEDLARWNRDRDRIATRWLESYFRVTSAEQAADDDTRPETPAVNEENDS
ncbi:type I-E CRISPR-associated protein Cse2/CasB [Streptomyces antibioticus]|uniref:type I-E CRISPR-associated protein Cse2/CasB n=1 Tax=Streptomyces antibioticus TaxID=1890 RepID=UPI0004C87219|nr:type I-E CRISPR-associated protein Cse2/CasB [Streptomyces antibioticus]MCX5172688.1 type I-E CRISPR-associated protein Cse2/CasB [Streptomyces antibioticus]